MALRIRAQLLGWRPSSPDDLALRDTIQRLAPAYTMLDLRRLRTLAGLALRVHRERIAGAVVECGTWRGGSLALIDWELRRRGEARSLWAFDSFEGLPGPGERDPLAARRGFFAGWCSASEADVRNALAVAGSTSSLHVVAGWLEHTLPASETGPVALLNIDVDWYESVRTALLTLYDRVSPGGIINFDDYDRWEGCNEAVDEFFRDRGIPIARLHKLDEQGAWFQKSAL